MGELVGFTPQLDSLGLYNSIDVALDTCPFSNVTTTCEALLMGVPTVSLVGETRASRAGATLLRAVGLADLAVTSCDDFVKQARRLAVDSETLTALRTSLRSTMLAS